LLDAALYIRRDACHATHGAALDESIFLVFLIFLFALLALDQRSDRGGNRLGLYQLFFIFFIRHLALNGRGRWV
jgi:hypothetical protein